MRLILASIVGTVIVFAWGGLSWMVMDLWSEDLRELPNADALMPAIKANVGATGAYAFPPLVESEGVSPEEARQAWTEQCAEGPVGILLVRPDGADTASPSMFIVGILLEFAGAMLLAVVLATAARAGHGPAGRMAIGIAIVGFAVIAGVLVPSNFMMNPAGWVRAMAGDLAIGWGLAVVAISIIVKAPRTGGRLGRS